MGCYQPSGTIMKRLLHNHNPSLYIKEGFYRRYFMANDMEKMKKLIEEKKNKGAQKQNANGKPSGKMGVNQKGFTRKVRSGLFDK